MSKMSKKEWEKLKAIALDHPFYDVYPLPLSEEEAEAIVAQNITMTGKEFVDSIYAKLGIPRPNRENRLRNKPTDEGIPKGMLFS